MMNKYTKKKPTSTNKRKSNQHNKRKCGNNKHTSKHTRQAKQPTNKTSGGTRGRAVRFLFWHEHLF